MVDSLDQTDSNDQFSHQWPGTTHQTQAKHINRYLDGRSEDDRKLGIAREYSSSNIFRKARKNFIERGPRNMDV
eukprot:scaffold2442_cov146-Cylindrotheca_fusiformis.AAC.4